VRPRGPKGPGQGRGRRGWAPPLRRPLLRMMPGKRKTPRHRCTTASLRAPRRQGKCRRRSRMKMPLLTLRRLLRRAGAQAAGGPAQVAARLRRRRAAAAAAGGAVAADREQPVPQRGQGQAQCMTHRISDPSGGRLGSVGIGETAQPPLPKPQPPPQQRPPPRPFTPTGGGPLAARRRARKRPRHKRPWHSLQRQSRMPGWRRRGCSAARVSFGGSCPSDMPRGKASSAAAWAAVGTPNCASWLVTLLTETPSRWRLGWQPGRHQCRWSLPMVAVAVAVAVAVVVEVAAVVAVAVVATSAVRHDQANAAGKRRKQGAASKTTRRGRGQGQRARRRSGSAAARRQRRQWRWQRRRWGSQMPMTSFP
jgi:hypothetical protein